KWSSIAPLPRPVTKTKCSIPASTASSTAYWITGLSTTVSISFGTALVAGRKRVPSPATGKTALRGVFCMSDVTLEGAVNGIAKFLIIVVKFLSDGDFCHANGPGASRTRRGCFRLGKIHVSKDARGAGSFLFRPNKHFSKKGPVVANSSLTRGRRASGYDQAGRVDYRDDRPGWQLSG